MSKRRRKRNAYRDNYVHVCKRMCETCPYRPETKDFEYRTIKRAVATNNALICHTLTEAGADEAVCRGFYEHDRTPLLEIAERLGAIRFTSD